MDVTETAQQRVRRSRDVSFYLLLAFGLVLVVTPFVSLLEDALERWVGVRRLLILVLGFSLFYLAFLIHDLAGVRQRNLVIMETLLAVMRGGIPRKDVEAVDILVAALRGRSENSRAAALRELKRLTGQDLGADPSAWEGWWEKNRENYPGTPETRLQKDSG